MSSYPNTRSHTQRLYRWVDDIHHRPMSLMAEYSDRDVDILEPFYCDECERTKWHHSVEPYRHGMYVDPNGFLSFEKNTENGYEWCYGYRVDKEGNMLYESIRRSF